MAGLHCNPITTFGWTCHCTQAQRLHHSANGHLDVVRLLLQSGAVVDTQDNDGWTPLHSASQSKNDGGHLDVVRLLLQSGATIESQKMISRPHLVVRRRYSSNLVLNLMTAARFKS
jgi:ankyrin repeat protein